MNLPKKATVYQPTFKVVEYDPDDYGKKSAS